jgi:anaerobic ribonucleoside-triphosphate reductase activating protein
MKYSKIDYMSIVDGTGCRVTLFVSGCRNHCKGCFNEQTWNFDFGEEFTPIQENEIIEACRKNYISGLTILGGEPFEEENQVALLPFIEKFKKECPGKNLWMFTGYVYEKDLVDGGKKFVENVTEKILENVDMLVDGPFIQEQRDLTLQFRGSSNQRLLTREDREILRQ